MNELTRKLLAVLAGFFGGYLAGCICFFLVRLIARAALPICTLGSGQQFCDLRPALHAVSAAALAVLLWIAVGFALYHLVSRKLQSKLAQKP